MKTYRKLTLTVLVAMLISGCVSSAKKPSSSDVTLAQQYIAKGESLEQENLFSSALEQYRLALTIDPENETAIQHEERILPVLMETARIHYEKGLALDQQGKYDAARKEYLSALQNWPEHKEAKVKLTPGGVVDDNRGYIIHTLAYGESVSKLGMLYYGDFKKLSVIGKFNVLKDVTKVRVGEKLKIPAIEGFPLSDLKQKQENYLNSQKALLPPAAVDTPVEALETAAVKTSAEPETVLQPPEETAVPEKKAMPALEETQKATKVSDAYAQGIELFNKKNYPESIPLFLKAAQADPDDATLLDYLFKSHFQQALLLFNSEDYLTAKNNFESALKYDKTCEKCPDYIEKCEATYKEKHYNLGIHYFGKEQLKKAIEEWELVKKIDPDYKELAPNLQKAELLLKRLESIKQSTPE